MKSWGGPEVGAGLVDDDIPAVEDDDLRLEIVKADAKDDKQEGRARYLVKECFHVLSLQNR